MYSKRDKKYVMKKLVNNGLNFRKTISEVGYPSLVTLQKWWVRAPEESAKKKRNDIRRKTIASNLRNLPVQLSQETKMHALHRCYTLGESPSKVAKELGASSGAVICNWRRQYLEGGTLKPMKKRSKSPQQEQPEVPDIRGDAPKNYEELKKAYEALQIERERLAMEKDVLEKTIEIIKKDPGVNPKALSNREKVVIIDALQEYYSRPMLREHLELSKSSYYYARSAMNATDKYVNMRLVIRDIFEKNRFVYGYRRIWGELRKLGIFLSEKVVRRLLFEEGLLIQQRKKRRYHSYLGELTPAPQNLIARDFQADNPNEKWLTDLTEFSISAGKVYLSPIIDCYDGMVVSWSLGTSPNAALVNGSLKKAMKKLNGETPIIHSDRGGHYRWPDWIHLTIDNNLIRSMSKKGCSPDNSACEGFFGRLKNKCFYNNSFTDMSANEFIAYIDDYIHWYNTKRSKQSLGYLSPVEYRQLLLTA